jgi:hypothetical protein
MLNCSANVCRPFGSLAPPKVGRDEEHSASSDESLCGVGLTPFIPSSFVIPELRGQVGISSTSFETKAFSSNSGRTSVPENLSNSSEAPESAVIGEGPKVPATHRIHARR